jgi:hypothetical protein
VLRQTEFQTLPDGVTEALARLISWPTPVSPRPHVEVVRTLEAKTVRMCHHLSQDKIERLAGSRPWVPRLLSAADWECEK